MIEVDGVVIKEMNDVKGTGRFLFNIHDPRDGREWMVYKTPAVGNIMEERTKQWRDHLGFLVEHIIGKPKCTKKDTVEQLEERHLVGVYETE